MLNFKVQNVKQAAYFDYFKSFSLNANDTIKKLELEFKEEIEESFFFESGMMFKRIKTLLGAYEILIYEINDSCEFVEIPEFGTCIMKIFLQILSVIRFLLHKLAEKSTKKQQTSGNHNIDKSPTQSKHATFSQTHQNFPSPHNQQRTLYKKKQQSKYLINNLSQELSLLQHQQTESIEASRKQFITLIQGRQKLQSIQISQNENILSEALNSFCKKGEHLKNFVNVRQAAMISNMKEGVGECFKLKDILDEDSSKKLENATGKLQDLFKNHTINFIKEKQSEMISQQIQVHFQEPLQNRILEQNKHIKRLNDIIKKLTDQMQFQRQKTKAIQNLLKSKTQQFQLKTMEYRVAKIQMQNMKAKNEKALEAESAHSQSKSKHQLLCTNCQNKFSLLSQNKLSSAGQCVSKSLIDGSEEHELFGQENDMTDNIEERQNPSRLMEKMTRRVHYHNLSTKKQFVYRTIDSRADQFELQSNLYEIKIQPWDGAGQATKKDLNKKKTTVRIPSTGNSNMNNTYSYRDHKRVKTKMFQSDSKSFEIERVFSYFFDFLPNANKRPSTSKDNQNRESKMFGIKKFERKFTETANQIDAVRQVTEKWLGNEGNSVQFDRSREDRKFSEESGNWGVSRQFYEKEGKQVRIMTPKKSGSREREQSPKNKSPAKQTPQFRKSKPISSLKKALSKMNLSSQKQNLAGQASQAQQQFGPRPQSEHYLSPACVPFTSDPTQLFKKSSFKLLSQQKFPKFIKFTKNQQFEFTMKQLLSVFLDMDTAKNFEYINLFQTSDQMMNKKRKHQSNVMVNIEQMKKKNIVMGLAQRVRGNEQQRDFCKTEGVMGSCNLEKQTKQAVLKGKDQNVQSQCSSMNATFSGTLSRTQFWQQFTKEALNTSQQQESDYTKLLRSYDFEFLVGILYKQLRDLRRLQQPFNPTSVTIYEQVRNFLRYPYSAVTLSKDKQFIEKQRQEGDIEYMQLRKIMMRITKLHSKCEQYHCGERNVIFDKLHIDNKKKDNMTKSMTNGKDNDEGKSHCLCEHVVEFYKKLGVVLLPTIS